MLVKITKDYTYALDKSAKRTLFAGSVYDEDAKLVAEIVKAGCAPKPGKEKTEKKEPEGGSDGTDGAGTGDSGGAGDAGGNPSLNV